MFCVFESAAIPFFIRSAERLKASDSDPETVATTPDLSDTYYFPWVRSGRPSVLWHNDEMDLDRPE